MFGTGVQWKRLSLVAGALAALGIFPSLAESMCGYSPPMPRITNTDINAPKPEVLQPAQVAFITWDPQKKIQTVSVQPRFEGNAEDFGMIIPTPAAPKLDEMPRDLFKALAVFTTPKKRVTPSSRMLMERDIAKQGGFGGMRPMGGARNEAVDSGKGGDGPPSIEGPRKSTVEVLGVGQVGAFNYKILKAGRADDLYTWLKDNKYTHTKGDEAVYDFYIKKKFIFTVMKIDTAQMKKNPDGSYIGEVSPTRFTFETDKMVYPLKITQASVKDKTEAVFYVLAPQKVDLGGDFTYQYDWVTKLQQAKEQFGDQAISTEGSKYLKDVRKEMPKLLKQANKLGFYTGSIPADVSDPKQKILDDILAPHGFKKPNEVNQPTPVLATTKDGRSASSLLWSKKLSAEDIKMLTGDAAYSEKVPNPDDGFARADLAKNPDAIYRVIERRLAKYKQDNPRGFGLREASSEELKTMQLLKGHLQEGMVLTKFRKVFTTSEMDEDLTLVSAKVGEVEDQSQYDEVLLPATPVLTLTWDNWGRGGRGWKGMPVDPGFEIPRRGFKE